MFEGVIRDLGGYNEEGGICWRILFGLDDAHSSSSYSAYLVVFVDFRYPPALLRVLGTDAEPLKLLPRVVNVPAVHVALGRPWLVRKRQQPVQPPDLARQGANAIVHIACVFLVHEIEGEHLEVATPQANRGRAATCRWGRSEDALGDDGIRNP